MSYWTISSVQQLLDRISVQKVLDRVLCTAATGTNPLYSRSSYLNESIDSMGPGTILY